MLDELGPLELRALKLLIGAEEVVDAETVASSSDLLLFLAATGELEAVVETFGVGGGVTGIGVVAGLNGEEFIIN